MIELVASGYVCPEAADFVEELLDGVMLTVDPGAEYRMSSTVWKRWRAGTDSARGKSLAQFIVVVG